LLLLGVLFLFVIFKRNMNEKISQNHTNNNNNIQSMLQIQSRTTVGTLMQSSYSLSKTAESCFPNKREEEEEE
jgi:hypothetical protein